MVRWICKKVVENQWRTLESPSRPYGSWSIYQYLPRPFAYLLTTQIMDLGFQSPWQECAISHSPPSTLMFYMKLLGVEDSKNGHGVCLRPFFSSSSFSNYKKIVSKLLYGHLQAFIPLHLLALERGNCEGEFWAECLDYENEYLLLNFKVYFELSLV